MNRTNRAIGIDIGGTKTVVAAVEASGRVHARAGFSTRSERGFSTCLAQLVECIRGVLHEAKWTAEHLAGIGIGCTGPVNPQRGTIHNPYTLPGWDGADIVTPLREALDAFFETVGANTTGEITLRLYKGNVEPVCRRSPYSLYSLDIASFTMGAGYDQKDALGFINLIGLPIQIRAAVTKKTS